MEISIQLDGNQWLVLMVGQPQRKFASKSAAWAFVMGITSADPVTVITYDANGMKQAEVTLNASVQA